MRGEPEFLDAIDCRFPFDDAEAAFALINEGCGISANAAFALVHEIVRPPRAVDVPIDLRQRLLLEVFAGFRHPLCSTIKALAERLVGGHEATVDEARRVMREIAKHRGQYAALCIAYFSAADPSEVLDQLDDEIRRSWATQQGHAADRPRAARD